MKHSAIKMYLDQLTRLALRVTPLTFILMLAGGVVARPESLSTLKIGDPSSESLAQLPQPSADSLRAHTDSPATVSDTNLIKAQGPPTPGARSRHGSMGGFFHSPTGTLLKSVAFPGWGQWSNGKKQKAAVYFGIETYFLTKALIWRHRALDRLHVWQNTNPDSTNALLSTFNSYDGARSRRNYFYWLTGITVFVSMFDAYADSYLLTLERTRNLGSEFWGGQAQFTPEDEIRVVLNFRF
jgi:hypothetical protein